MHFHTQTHTNMTKNFELFFSNINLNEEKLTIRTSTKNKKLLKLCVEMYFFFKY